MNDHEQEAAYARARIEHTLEDHTGQLHDIDAQMKSLVSTAVSELKKEVRWLIVLSVGLNQLIYNVDISSVAKAAVAGSAVTLWVGAKALISFGLWQ